MSAGKTLNDHLAKQRKEFWRKATPEYKKANAERLSKARKKKRAEEVRLMKKAKEAGLL